MLTCSRFEWHIYKNAWFLAIKLAETDISEAIASYNFHSSHVYRGKGITCSCITLTSTSSITYHPVKTILHRYPFYFTITPYNVYV
jgi:hypothetical protein